MTAAEVIRLRLLTQVATLRQQDPWVRYDAPAAIHDLRLTVQRLRQALASYRRYLDAERSEPLREELGWLAGHLGDVRDAEVQFHLLRGLLDAEPESLVRGPVRTRLEEDLHQRHGRARAGLAEAMSSARYVELVDGLQIMVEAPPWTDHAQQKAGRALRKSLDDDWKRLRACVLRAAGEGDRGPSAAGDLRALHQAAERVRYAAETLLPLKRKSAGRMVRAHERIQAAVGDQRDAADAQATLDRLADEAAVRGENAFTYGLLHARLQARSAARAEDVDQAWQDSLTARARLRAG